MRGIHQWLVNSPCKRPVTQKMFPFDDVIMQTSSLIGQFIPPISYQSGRVKMWKWLVKLCTYLKSRMKQVFNSIHSYVPLYLLSKSEMILKDTFSVMTCTVEKWPRVKGVHWWPMDSPHKGPIKQKEFLCYDIIMLPFYMSPRGSCAI